MVRDLRVGYPAVALLILYVILMIEFGSLIWVPIAIVLGLRIILIVADVIFPGDCI